MHQAFYNKFPFLNHIVVNRSLLNILFVTSASKYFSNCTRRELPQTPCNLVSYCLIGSEFPILITGITISSQLFPKAALSKERIVQRAIHKEAGTIQKDVPNCS